MLAKFKRKFIGDKAFYTSVLTLVIPLIIQQGITSFVSLLDNIMVGALGTASISLTLLFSVHYPALPFLALSFSVKVILKISALLSALK